MKRSGGIRSLRLQPIPLLLALLAVLDLRVELQLLNDHFTLTSLVALVHHHPLAVCVLVLTPWLWSRCA
ncbi:MAG: hypothetical protein FJ056_00820 [Cyanobacteria bacterium M_surface_10_m2_179]|nr:hypothetical protein [Cyanobacteria bacterium M_surface_10_m2_179]